MFQLFCSCALFANSFLLRHIALTHFMITIFGRLITLLLRALVLEAKLVSQPGFTQSWQLMIGHNDMLLTTETEGVKITTLSGWSMKRAQIN